MGMVGLRDVFVVAPAASFHPAAPPPEPLFSAAEHPIIPLLTAAPCLVEDSRAAKPSGGIHLFQPQPPHQNPNPNSCFSGSPSTCQDCGNQAKKDCSHRRCRTCCKSRGFDCSTHIKSTWVPAARRRERQLTVGSSAGAGSSASTSASKKARLISSQTTTTSHTSSSFDTSSSHQEMAEASFRENLPGHVRAPAVFKCVRVTSVDDGEDQYAYQAMVTIGGHVFKGFLYDQGADDASRADLTGNSPVNNVAIPNISEMHLGAARRAAAAAPSTAVLTSDVYASASGGCGFLGGAAYGVKFWYETFSSCTLLFQSSTVPI